MVENLFKGAGYVVHGMRLILRPGLRRFVIVPVAVNLIVFSALIWLGITQFDAALDLVLPDSGWAAYFRWLLWPLFALALVLIVFYTFTVVANLIAAPFNSLLAERVEHLLTGRVPEGGFGSLWAEILPTLTSELRKLWYFLARAVPLLLLFLIPGLNLAAPLLWLLFSAWFLAIEYGDYPMGNHGMTFPAQYRRLKAERAASVGLGAGITLLMMVPVLSFLAMPSAVAGATVFWCERLADDASPR